MKIKYSRTSRGPRSKDAQIFRSHQLGLQLPSPWTRTYRNESLQVPHYHGRLHSVSKAMDPAGRSSCAPDHHNVEGSNPHTLYSTDTDPEAQRDLSGHGRSEAKTDYGLQPMGADFPKEAAQVARKSKDQYRWRRVIRNFTPSYAEAFPPSHYR